MISPKYLLLLIISFTLLACQTIERADSYNWIQSPYKYWAFKNMDKIFDIGKIVNNSKTIPLDSALQDLADLDITQLDGSVLKLNAHLKANRADALLVMQNGKIVAEHYLKNMKQNSHHIWFSMSKSLTSVALGILVDEDRVDLQQQIIHYLPELKGSAWDGVTVQMVMNMTNSVKFSEDYHDLDSDLYQFSKVARFVEIKNSAAKFDSVPAYLKTVQPEGEHNQYFHYVS